MGGTQRGVEKNQWGVPYSGTSGGRHEKRVARAIKKEDSPVRFVFPGIRLEDV